MTLLKESMLVMPGYDKWTRRDFDLQTRCVTALYGRLFPKFRTKDCWKIEIECVDEITKERFRNVGGVYVLQSLADAREFLSMTDNNEKKEWTFEQLKIGIDRLLAQTGWPAKPFQDTFRAVTDLHLVNRWSWKRRVLSPNRKMIAEVQVDHDVQQCDISILIRDGAGALVAQHLAISEQPSEWAFARHIGSLRWVSPTRVVLTNQSGDREWSADIGEVHS